MTSRKRSARARQREEFESQRDGADDLFAREAAAQAKRERQHDEALLKKACTSKRRYASHIEAEDAAAWCADHGRTGLRIYRCPYCGGWHLTSKPEDPSAHQGRQPSL